MVDDARLAAELAYQRALAALHDVRSDLADVAAARRRLVYERGRLDPADADSRERALADRATDLAERADLLRGRATTLRDEVRRLSGDTPPEPSDVPEPGEHERFEQPPFVHLPGSADAADPEPAGE